REPRARNRHARANLDAFGGLRRQRHHRVAVRPDHLRVRHPRALVAKLLGVTDEFPFVDVRVETDAEFHNDAPCGISMKRSMRNWPALRGWPAVAPCALLLS